MHQRQIAGSGSHQQQLHALRPPSGLHRRDHPQHAGLERQLRGWSHLRRDDLLAFVKQQLAADLVPAAEPQVMGAPPEASCSERLLWLVLRHLGVPQEEVEAAWLGPAEQGRASVNDSGAWKG